MPTPISSYAAALSAYAQAAGAVREAPPAGAETKTGAVVGSFAETLSDMLQQAVAAGKTGEKRAMAAITGREDLAGVVSAVAEAEVVLQSVIAIRDRAIEAYKEITRMPI